MLRTGLLVLIGTTLASLVASEVGFRELSTTHSRLMPPGRAPGCLACVSSQLPLQLLLRLRPWPPTLASLSPVSHAVPSA